jgi:hypothetical protein
MAARTLGLAFATLLAIARPTSFFAAQAAQHVRLANEGSSGPLYECNATACARAQTDNPSRKNLGEMDFYVLPDGCVTLASAVLRPDGPGIDVECGPPGKTMRHRCEGGSCRPLDSTAGAASATARPIPLPADCGGRIHEIIVVGAPTASPAFFIECDASSGPRREQ